MTVIWTSSRWVWRGISDSPTEPRRRCALAVSSALALMLTMGGCVSPAPKPVVVLAPFDDTPVSFVVGGHFFASGEWTLVRVCIDAHRRIVSSEVVQSSGDKRFDDMALDWARTVRLHAPPQQGELMASCGAVRVEIRHPSEPRIIQGADSSLG